MELMTSWRRDGIKDGKKELITRLTNRRFGAVSSQILERFDKLSSEQLDELGQAFLDFTSVADLENWLSGTTHSKVG